MSKVAVVFWSATGNTETMANCIAEGANGTLVPLGDMTPAKLAEFDVVAFGCPAMGAEQLEEGEFEPMFAGLEGSLNGKRSPCSAPTAGATASGCVTGWSVLRAMAPRCLAARASSATRPPMTMCRPPAASWVQTWLHGKQKGFVSELLLTKRACCVKLGVLRFCGIFVALKVRDF